jgi:hypothetical protein
LIQKASRGRNLGSNDRPPRFYRCVHNARDRLFQQLVTHAAKTADVPRLQLTKADAEATAELSAGLDDPGRVVDGDDHELPASVVTVTASLTRGLGIAARASRITRNPGNEAMTAPKPYSEAVFIEASSEPATAIRQSPSRQAWSGDSVLAPCT